MSPFLEAFQQDLFRLHPAPWYLERCNASGVEVRDNTGYIVFIEDFAPGPDHGPNAEEAFAERAVALAKYLVAMSEEADR